MSNTLSAVISNPIDATTPQGAPVDDEDVDFGKLETELMKRGGLSQSAIDWSQVEVLSRRILTEKSKHMVALAGLCGAMARKGDAAQCLAAVEGATAFVEKWWDSAHPEGKRMARRRTAIAEEIAQTLGRAAHAFGHEDAEGHGRLIAAFEAMKAQWQAVSIPTKTIDEAIDRLQAGPEAASTDAPRPAGGLAPKTDSPVRTDAPTGDPLAAMDTREIRRYREEIKAFADRVGALDPEAPMPFRLRRYAAWLRQNQAPIADGEGCTTIQPMPGFIANEFAAALATPDRGTLARLEDRLFTDPYWFEGHRLAATLAMACGLDEAARTVRAVVAERVQRFPELETLRLTDGSPMIDEEARAWLAAVPGAGAEDAPWTAALAEAQQDIESGDIGAAFALLESGLDSATSDRERAYWRLAFADLLAGLDLDRLAGEMVAGLLRDLDTPAIQAWEPDLLRRVKSRCGERGGAG